MQYNPSATHRSSTGAMRILFLLFLLAPIAAMAGVAHSVDPTSNDYGDQRVGTSSGTQTFTFTNEFGVTAVTVTSVDLSGTNPGDFSIDSENCTSGSPIAAGGTCTAEVSFGPTATGARAALTSASGRRQHWMATALRRRSVSMRHRRWIWAAGTWAPPAPQPR